MPVVGARQALNANVIEEIGEWRSVVSTT